MNHEALSESRLTRRLAQISLTAACRTCRHDAPHAVAKPNRSLMPCESEGSRLLPGRGSCAAWSCRGFVAERLVSSFGEAMLKDAKAFRTEIPCVGEGHY